MEWYQQLVNKLAPLKYEMVRVQLSNDHKILFIGPRNLDGQTERDIIEMLPEKDRPHAAFTAGIKQSTNQAVMQLLQQTGHITGVVPFGQDKYLTLSVTATGDVPGYIWDGISDLFKRDGFLTGWRIIVNGHVVIKGGEQSDGDDTPDIENAPVSKDKAPQANEHIAKAAEVAIEERKNCDRTHPPSLEEIDKLKVLLDQCEDVDLLSKIL